MPPVVPAFFCLLAATCFAVAILFAEAIVGTELKGGQFVKAHALMFLVILAGVLLTVGAARWRRS